MMSMILWVDHMMQHEEKVTKRAVVADTTQKCTKVSRVCWHRLRGLRWKWLRIRNYKTHWLDKKLVLKPPELVEIESDELDSDKDMLILKNR